MNVFKLTYTTTGHAILIDVLNIEHAILVCKSESARCEDKVTFEQFDDLRGDYLTTTYSKAPCGTRPAGLEKVMWYELPESRKLRVTDGNGRTYTQDRGAV